MNGCGRTDRGIVRKDNQDYFHLEILDEGAVCVSVVCDGMGGAKAGNVASRLAAESFAQAVMAVPDKLRDPSQVSQVLEHAVTAANRLVHEGSLAHEDYKGMGTTLVGAVILGETAYIINVGDSRAYRVSDTEIVRLTRDHSLVEDMVVRGDITREEAATHPNRNLITRALGTERQVAGDIFKITFQKGERLLLCTDGLTNLVSEAELLREMNFGHGLEKTCEMLIHLALAHGGSDNVTALIVEI